MIYNKHVSKLTFINFAVSNLVYFNYAFSYLFNKIFLIEMFKEY